MVKRVLPWSSPARVCRAVQTHCVHLSCAQAIEAEADAKQRETASPVPPLASVPAMLQAALAAWLGGIVTRLDSAVRALAAPSSTDAADAPDSEDDEGAAAASPAIDAATQQVTPVVRWHSGVRRQAPVVCDEQCAPANAVQAARQVLEDAWRKS